MNPSAKGHGFTHYQTVAKLQTLSLRKKRQCFVFEAILYYALLKPGETVESGYRLQGYSILYELIKHRTGMDQKA